MPYTQRFLLGFCGGALILGLPWQGDALLPARVAVLGVAGVVFLVVLALFRARRGNALLWLTLTGIPLGLAWSGSAHDAALSARLDDGGSGDTVTLTGWVVGDPVAIDSGQGQPAQRFQALVTSQSSGARIDAAGATVRLSWYGGAAVANGELWKWTAVLHGPWSYANPGGFDYERWLLGAGLQGTGYVRSGERLHASPAGLLERVRGGLTERVDALELPNGGVVLALLIGRSDGISEALWNTLRATGTVHLMVISGLHVSLAAAIGFALGRLLGRLCPLLPLWLDVRTAGCLVGSAVAVCYVMLAGAGLPALRALVMSGATLALLAGGRTGRLGAGLLLALAALLAVQPLAIHQQGFWLSFGAVGILYLSLGHRHGDGRGVALLRAQLSLSLGMLPLVAISTGTLPWTGVPANLLAVPVMSLVVVPAALLGGSLTLVSPAASGWALVLADAVMGGVLQWLDWLALAPLPAANGGMVALAVAQAGALFWLLGVPRRQLPALVLCCALPLASPASGVSHGEYRVMALDVGQGTAVAIDTRRHRLLFDAGPAFPSGFDVGTAVVVPSLAATGPARLNALILSHGDIDHTGGADAVRTSLAPELVLSPDGGETAAWGAAAGSGKAERCDARQWRWDGVTFHLLGIDRPMNAADNDRSCILLVDDGRYRMLIGGDISARVEAQLLRALAPVAPVHIMFAPHHGSLSSSSMALVRVLDPRLVLVNAGRGNRFGHPHPQVVARYRQVGARLFQTGREGALIWRSSSPHRLIRWRRDRSRYWRGRDPGVTSRTITQAAPP